MNIYASSPRYAASLVGNHENTDIGQFLSDFLELDMEDITHELREKGKGFKYKAEGKEATPWMGGVKIKEEVLGHGDHYHGDFKRGLECGCGR